MQIEYTGRQTEVPQHLRSLAEKKLRKLDKFLRITHAHVVLTADKHRHIAEVTVLSPNLTLTANEQTTDLEASLATVLDKLTKQARKHTGKIQQRKRRAPGRTRAIWSNVLASTAAPASGAGASAETPGPRIIRTRRFVPRPMTVEEAVLEVGSGDEDFLVFREASTERLNVLYRRKDGNLGLIEPEA